MVACAALRFVCGVTCRLTRVRCFVSARQIIEATLCEKDEMIVLACDGLFDVMSSQSVRGSDCGCVCGGGRVAVGSVDGCRLPTRACTLLRTCCCDEPQVTSFARQAMSDGHSPPEIAKQLAEYALSLASTDNISVVVVKVGAGLGVRAALRVCRGACCCCYRRHHVRRHGCIASPFRLLSAPQPTHGRTLYPCR